MAGTLTKTRFWTASLSCPCWSSASSSRSSRSASASPPQPPWPWPRPPRRRSRRWRGGSRRGEERVRRDPHRAGDKKIQVIKEVRALTSLGLKEQGPRGRCPKPVLEKANKEDAEKAKAQLEGAGANRRAQVATPGSRPSAIVGRARAAGGRPAGPGMPGPTVGRSESLTDVPASRTLWGPGYQGSPVGVVIPCASGYAYWLPCLPLSPSSAVSAE